MTRKNMMNFGKILALTLLSSGLTACVGNQAFVATPANYQQNTSIQLPIEKRYIRPLHNLADHPAEARIMLILSRFA